MIKRYGMKRYTMSASNGAVVPHESETGRWVEWEDHAKDVLLEQEEFDGLWEEHMKLWEEHKKLQERIRELEDALAEKDKRIVELEDILNQITHEL